MEKILGFLADNYLWFMIGAGVLLLALIGFVVNGRKEKKNNDNNASLPGQDAQPAVVPTSNPLETQMPSQPVQNVQPDLSTQPTVNAEATVQTAEEKPTLIFEEPSFNDGNSEAVSNALGDSSSMGETPESLDNAPTLGEPISVDAPVETPTVETPVAEPVVEPVTEPLSAEPIIETPSVSPEPIAPVANEPITSIFDETPNNAPVENVVPEAPIVEAPSAPTSDAPII